MFNQSIQAMNSFNVDGVKFNPRNYQVEGLKKILSYLKKAYKSGESRPAFVEYSVGYGKTGIYAFIARHVIRNNKKRKEEGKPPFRVLIIAHQTELTKQNSLFAWDAGVINTVVASELNKGKHAKKLILQDVVFANVKTLDNRIKSGMFKFWKPDLIMVDECHRQDWENFIKYQRGDNTEEDKQAVYTKVLFYFLAKNKNVQVIGGSGSPWRNNKWIKGDYWESCIDRKDTLDLVNEGFLVPIKWGQPKAKYDYSKLDYELKESGLQEIDLKEAEKITSEQLTTTNHICNEVVELTKGRNACLVFCSGQNHLKETRLAFISAGVDENHIGVITDSTNYENRTDILDRAKIGKCKFVLNVAVLTTGVNVPLWDSLVFMRPVGSVVLFVQSVGRVLRKHDDDVKALGYKEKKSALVLDYAGVYGRLGHLADELSEEPSEYENIKKDIVMFNCTGCGQQIKLSSRLCPLCSFDFGEAKVCRGAGNLAGCGHVNKSTARRCEKCHTPLKDVNSELSRDHYCKSEFEPVKTMSFEKVHRGRSKCSVGVHINLVSGRVIDYKWYSSVQLKDFVLMCDISEETKKQIKDCNGALVDNFVIKRRDLILPNAFAAQRIDSTGKGKAPRMMSTTTYYSNHS